LQAPAYTKFPARARPLKLLPLAAFAIQPEKLKKKLHDTLRPGDSAANKLLSRDQGHKRSEKIRASAATMQFLLRHLQAPGGDHPAKPTRHPAMRIKINTIDQIPYQRRDSRRRYAACSQNNNSGRRSGGGHDGTKGVCAAPPPS